MKKIIKLARLIVLAAIIGLGITTCEEAGEINVTSGAGGVPVVIEINTPGSGGTGGGYINGGLYAKAPPILPTDTPVNLSGTAGATIVDQSFNYINNRPGTYTLVMNGNVSIAGEYIIGDYGGPPVRHIKSSNTKLTIIGDNQERKISLNSPGRMFTVGEAGRTGISLTLGNNIILDGNDNGYEMVYIQNNASFIMQDNSRLSGAIQSGVYVINGSNFLLQGNASVSGNNIFAIIVLNGSTITIQDNASVSGNSGYGVIVRNALAGDNGNSSTFIMRNNALVSNNSSGVLVVGSNFTMHNYASVSNNYGRGVAISTSNFTMRDNSKVSGNVTSTLVNGAGVYVYGGVFKMQNNASITGNRTTGISLGGGVFVCGEYYNGVEYIGYLIMEGGTVSGNTAGTGYSISQPSMGGGVYIDSYGTLIMSGGIIYGNDASEQLRNNAWIDAALRLSSSTSGPQIAKYGNGNNILPHTQGDIYGTNHTIYGK